MLRYDWFWENTYNVWKLLSNRVILIEGLIWYSILSCKRTILIKKEWIYKNKFL